MRLTRTVGKYPGSDVRFWAWNDYTIEELWDYGFIEVSTDGDRPGPSSRSTTRPETSSPPTMTRTGGWLLRQAEERHHRGLRGVPAPVGRPHPVHGPDHPAAAAPPRTPRSRAWLVRRRLLGDRGRGHGVLRRLENGDNGWTPEVATRTARPAAAGSDAGTLEFEPYYLVEWRNLRRLRPRPARTYERDGSATTARRT